MQHPRITSLLAIGAAPLLLAAPHTMAQGWPPRDVDVKPECPHPTSKVVVELAGLWGSSCIPNASTVIRSGMAIDINLRTEPPPKFCLTVITPWSLPNDLGQLPAGTYSVYSTYLEAGVPVTTRALIATIIVDPECSLPCYANCDGSTVEPILNVDDFTCFINEFAAAQSLPHHEKIEHYANCDQSTTAPVLNVDDFTCFINAFANGCP